MVREAKGELWLYTRGTEEASSNWFTLFVDGTFGFSRLAFSACLPYNAGMYDEDENGTEVEFGSDELLASDELRLPASANILVRLHALRSWLHRHHNETELAIGTAALALQEAMSEPVLRPRRRLAEQNETLVLQAQQTLAEEQERLSAYEEAQTLLEDCVTHITASERVLVEYYLALEELLQAADKPADTPWRVVLSAVLHRVEQVGTPGEEDV